MAERKNIIKDFEDKVLRGLNACGVSLAHLKDSGKNPGVAVSGGADSVALLVSLAHIFKGSGIKLCVINVNHNMRTKLESEADSVFVKDFCENLNAQGFDVSVVVSEIAQGLVFRIADERKNGLEEAARFLRYKAFEEFSARQNTAFICLAHNRNDALETSLMRFLQGSSGSIAAVRENYVRPLLDISREEIEAYLTAQNISWRTDTTNFDENYLRNRIRHSLIPLLNEKFLGWDSAVISASARAAEDFSSLESLTVFHKWQIIKDSVCMDRAEFCSCHAAIRRRLLYNAFNLLKLQVRVPYSIIEAVQNAAEKKLKHFSSYACGIQITFNENYVSVKKKKNLATESCFFAIIEKSGVYDFTFGSMTVEIKNNRAFINLIGKEGSFYAEGLSVPFCIRSRHLSDSIKTADGTFKSVSDIFSDWHIPEEKRDFIPLIQLLDTKEQEIIIIAGSVFGFSDWIVRG